MSLETVVDILISHGIGGNSLRQYADREFGVIDPETGQRDASNKYDHNAAPDAQPEGASQDSGDSGLLQGGTPLAGGTSDASEPVAPVGPDTTHAADNVSPATTGDQSAPAGPSASASEGTDADGDNDASAEAPSPSGPSPTVTETTPGA